jgi:hypothetical protein
VRTPSVGHRVGDTRMNLSCRLGTFLAAPARETGIGE